MSLPPPPLPPPPHPHPPPHHRSESNSNRPPLPPLPPDYRPDSQTHPLFAPMPERIMPSLPADVRIKTCHINRRAKHELNPNSSLTSNFFIISSRSLAHSTTLLPRPLQCPTNIHSTTSHIHHPTNHHTYILIHPVYPPCSLTAPQIHIAVHLPLNHPHLVSRSQAGSLTPADSHIQTQIITLTEQELPPRIPPLEVQV